MNTRSHTASASAPPEPPSPMTTVTVGILSPVNVRMLLAMAPAWPPSSASLPG